MLLLTSCMAKVLRCEVLTEATAEMDSEPEPELEPAHGQAVTAIFANAVAQVRPSVAAPSGRGCVVFE